MAFDPDRILEQLLEIFVSEHNTWLTFRQLASRTTGDPSQDYLIAGVVDRHQKMFVVHRDCRCKLRSEFIEGAAAIEPPAKAPAEPIYIQAARAVREYARQLRPVHLKVIGSDKGKRVLDRYLHALEVELVDDDIRLSDDTPVEFLSAQRSKNPGHIVGASRDEALLYVAFESEVLPIDIPGWLEVSRALPYHNLAEYLSSLTAPPPLAAGLNASRTQAIPLQDEDQADIISRSSPKLPLIPVFL